MDVEKDLLQEIIISTKKGRTLKLYICKQSGGYRLYGEDQNQHHEDWSPIHFPDEYLDDAKILLANCIENFLAALVKSNDEIASIHNPCNAPFVNKSSQEGILNQLGVVPPVSVN